MIPSRSTATMASGRVSRRSFERRTSAIVVAERERAGCLRVEEGRGIQFRFEPSVLNLCRSRLVCKGVKRGYAVRAPRRDRDLEPRTNIRIPAMLPRFLLKGSFATSEVCRRAARSRTSEQPYPGLSAAPFLGEYAC